MENNIKTYKIINIIFYCFHFLNLNFNEKKIIKPKIKDTKDNNFEKLLNRKPK